VSPEARGGFLALETPDAAGLFERLLQRGVRTDYRDSVLRFGPAPYLTDAQIIEAMRILAEVAKA
jgi:kynureninase